MTRRVYIVIKDDHALVKVTTPQQRAKIQEVLGYVPQGYIHPFKRGEWRAIPKKKIEKVRQIEGVTPAFWDWRLIPLEDYIVDSEGNSTPEKKAKHVDPRR